MAIKLRYPLSKIYITQKFGLNPQIYKQFGMKGHNGIDFRTKFPDTPKGRRYVYASKAGRVYEVVNQGKSGYGLFVRLMHEGNEQTIYAHLYKSYVKKGQAVKEGQKIALSDNTGFSTAAHLHFGYRPKNFKYNNGYKGYIDPIRLFYKPIATPAPKPVPVKPSVPEKNFKKEYDICHAKLIECNKESEGWNEEIERRNKVIIELRERGAKIEEEIIAPLKERIKILEEDKFEWVIPIYKNIKVVSFKKKD